MFSLYHIMCIPLPQWDPEGSELQGPTCPFCPELLRLKLFMDMRPKAFGSTIPPGGWRGVIGGRLAPCVRSWLLLEPESAKGNAS
jgi:hypothetical protein